MKSPCNKVCQMDPKSGLCIGCARTLDEIARWAAMSDAERERVLAELPQRAQIPKPPVRRFKT
ncbi:MAG TPA: DUF1289 domain-containing protein [Burkholderiales bacterium]|nr:DUF1289 domain-containing protein [Burkholderiales bacterium]